MYLAGDRLVDGAYVPTSIQQTPERHYWAHSDSLNRDLCWEEGNRRFWDPVSRTYLYIFVDGRAARSAAEDRAVAAEARVSELQGELSRLENP